MGSMYHDKIIKRIPGQPHVSPKERQGYIDDLSSKTKIELLEMIERQNKLLQNRNFIKKLPDKGARISEFREKLQNELLNREKLMDEACGMLSTLSIGTDLKNPTESLEWTGKFPSNTDKETKLDSVSDDETDVLKILASNAGTVAKKKKHRVEKPEVPLIKPEDLEDIKPNVVPDPYVQALCQKIDTSKNIKKPFKPNQTLKSQPEGKATKPKSRFWEVTAATPPPPVYGDTKLVSLQESLTLQVQQVQHLKKVQTKHAAERLAARFDIKMGDLPHESLRTTYRTTRSPYDSDSESENRRNPEHSDEDDEHEPDVAVIYSLTDPDP